jgi:hypothetical protein
MKKYNIQIGDLFHIPHSETTILITRLPNNRSDYYRGIYSENIKETNVGTYEGISVVIDNGDWIYYPVDK